MFLLFIYFKLIFLFQMVYYNMFCYNYYVFTFLFRYSFLVLFHLIVLDNFKFISKNAFKTIKDFYRVVLLTGRAATINTFVANYQIN